MSLINIDDQTKQKQTKSESLFDKIRVDPNAPKLRQEKEADNEAGMVKPLVVQCEGINFQEVNSRLFVRERERTKMFPIFRRGSMGTL